MGLDHDFFIVDDVDKSSWSRLSSEFLDDRRKFEHVSVYDGYLSYFGDYTRFLPLWNPCRDEPCEGLCMCGITKIPNGSLAPAIEILGHLLGIFSLAPDEVRLRGGFVMEDEGEGWEGHYEMLRTSRDKICGKLRALIDLFSKAKAENKCIMHCGI